MSYEAENRQALVSYFRRGAKGDAPLGALGVEVEHFVVRGDDARAVPYDGADLGVKDVLEHLRPFYPEETLSLDGDLLGLASPEASVTLEPAAQLEISIAPYRSIDDIVAVYERFRSRVDPFLAERGARLVAAGYHPSARALDLPLIPKQRYRFMDAYFRDLGTHGERMMRASASTQVSIDYRDEADAIRKMRIAQAIAPVLASLAENVSAFEGQPPQGQLTRMELWRDVDDARCGAVPGLFDEDFGFEAYADWVLGACPIFVTRAAADDPDGPVLRSVAGQTAAQAYGDAPMSEADIEHLLSMFWPDVRLKRFVEIRPADSLPAERMAGYAALIKGLFYSDEALAALEDAFGVVEGRWPLTDASTEEALAAVRRDGDVGVFSGRTLAEWRQLVVDLARESLSPEDRQHLAELRP